MSPSKSSNNFRAYLIIGVGGGLILALLSWYNYQTFSNLGQLDPDSADCVRTRAKVLDRTPATPGIRESRPRLTYRYASDDGQVHETTEAVDPYYYQQAADNDTLTICYDRSAPAQSVIPGNSYETVDLIETIIVDLILIGCVIAVLIWVRRAKQKEKAAGRAGT